MAVADTSVITAQFASSLTEDFTPADTPEIAAQFAVSRAENFDPADVYDVYFAALQDISEPIDEVADANTQQSNFGQSITENSNLNDVRVVTAQFASSQTESYRVFGL
jgi:hypothetical protein